MFRSDKMEESTIDFLVYIARILGRVGFVVLLVGLFRFYNLFASPQLRKRSRSFIQSFSFVLVVSFVLLILEFLVSIPWLTVVTMTFNVISLYILVWYLFYNVNIMEKRKESVEFKAYTKAMDAFIDTLKHPQRNDFS